MISVYIKEQKRYYKNELLKILNIKPDDFVAFIRRVKSYGVLKMVQATPEERELSELVDEDIVLVNEEENIENHFYVFTYVGVLIVGQLVLKCYPKYISNPEPLAEMKQLLQVLKKYNSKEQIINVYNGDAEDVSFNMLAVSLYLLEDYLENGPYTNQRSNIEINGSGEILWDETINETFALIKQNRPYYMELKTINYDEDEQDFFRRLHKSIVAECSSRLEEASISQLFDLRVNDKLEDKVDDFGDEEYILYRIRKELDVQYYDRKKMILKVLYTYISHRRAFDNGFGLSMFGTNSFNLVWEGVCAEVYNNCLNLKIKDLPLASTIDIFKNDNRTLSKIIEKPKWRYKNTDHLIEHQKTLIPDLISIYQFQEDYCFSILDAKYYLIKLNEKEISGQPGVGDITKQYLYQLAYQGFVKRIGYKYVQNAFLFPGENEEYLGNVEFDMMMIAGKTQLEHISAIKLPASKMYNSYISGKEDKSLLDILKSFLKQKLNIKSVNSQNITYFNSRETISDSKRLPLQKESVISYPETIISNIKAKVLFDIIILEVGRHIYKSSNFIENGANNLVAESSNNIFDNEQIGQLVLNIMNDYIQYSAQEKKTLKDANNWIYEYLLESNTRLLNINGITEKISNALFALYND